MYKFDINSSGKYLIENFILTPEVDGDVPLEEHIYGHCLEVVSRLIGSISILGFWSTFEAEDKQSINVGKKLRKEKFILTDIISLIINDNVINGKRIKDSGDIQKIDVKTVQPSKWETSIASGTFSFISQFAAGK